MRKFVYWFALSGGVSSTFMMFVTMMRAGPDGRVAVGEPNGFVYWTEIVYLPVVSLLLLFFLVQSIIRKANDGKR